MTGSTQYFVMPYNVNKRGERESYIENVVGERYSVMSPRRIEHSNFADKSEAEAMCERLNS